MRRLHMIAAVSGVLAFPGSIPMPEQVVATQDPELDDTEVDVVFSYGDFGPGGLTPEEASKLARAITTEGSTQRR